MGPCPLTGWKSRTGNAQCQWSVQQLFRALRLSVQEDGGAKGKFSDVPKDEQQRRARLQVEQSLFLSVHSE